MEEREDYDWDFESDMISSPSDIVPKVDWVAYFQEFCRVHGPPVQYGSVFLFPDGWSYSSSDYLGPEWPPDENEARRNKDKKRYWVRRRSLAQTYYEEFKTSLNALKELQEIKSAPLQRSRWSEVTNDAGEATGQLTVVSETINVEMLQIELDEVQAELDLCNAEIIKFDKKRVGYKEHVNG